MSLVKAKMSKAVNLQFFSEVHKHTIAVYLLKNKCSLMFPNYNNQKEDNVSPSKFSRKWKTNVWFALHRKLATPVVLLNDFCSDLAFCHLGKGRKTALLPGVGRMVVWGCVGVRWGLCCIPGMELPPGVILGHCLGLLCSANAPYSTVLNTWR